MCYIINKIDGVYTPVKINGKSTHLVSYRTKKEAEAVIKILNEVIEVKPDSGTVNLNKENDDRVKRDREKANKAVTRQYKLKR